MVISGPSGVGKTTLVDAVLARKSLPLRRAVTATTRKPRPGEVDEVSYHFWTRDRFREAIDRHEMLEWAEVHQKDFYGTPLSEVEPYRASGTGVILVIDVQGAGMVRLRYPDDVLTVFVAPPAFDILQTRLEGRGEAAESIRIRLTTAHNELSRQDEYDTVLVNDEVAAATTALEQIIRDDFHRRGIDPCSTS
ncbi:MAG: guanylate kinase [Gemmataceae bacterium]|nr:guanylate kinase [Gemmataceae bacterium]